MKKESFSILFLLFFVLFAACSGDKKTNEENENADSDQTPENEGSDDDAVSNNPDFGDLECGHDFGDIACDFTLPFGSGDWNFAANYSKNENYIFVFYRKKNSQSKTVWSSELYTLFDRTPENTHYFFMVDTDDADFAKENAKVIMDSVEEASYLVGNAPLLKKIHILEKPLAETDSWISEWLENNKSEFFFGIDGERRIRRGGSFASWEANDRSQKFKNLFKEAELYNYERQISDFIEENSDNSTVFKGLDKVPFAEEEWAKDLFFEADFKGLSGNGEFYIMLEQLCEDSKKCEWDRLERLFLCDEKGENCETEIGRWITTYGRSGKWLTDITPLKTLFAEDGKYRFKLAVEGDYYVNSLNFIFVKKDTDSLPPLHISP